VAELRKDPTRGQWVLIRPKGTWAPDAPCRYCPGAEHLTGAEISAYRKDGSLANGPGWTVRVVPEADAYFRIECELVREGEVRAALDTLGAGVRSRLRELSDDQERGVGKKPK